MTKTTATLLLFDGHSMAHRAFHGAPPLTTKSGQSTNMLVGFLASFFKIYRTYQPEKVVVCFDLPEPTFRHKQFKDYKAHRSPTPPEFKEQMELLHEILNAFGVRIVEKGGFEADDLLATLAKQGQKNKTQAIVVTGDRDCFQLVKDPYIKVLYTPSKGEPKLLDEARVKEKVGIPPDVYLHYAALKGDPSDNLGGVVGVGEKTALALIEAFGNVSNLYKELKAESQHQSLKPKVRQSLKDSRDIVDRNLDLMKLKSDVELKIKFSDLGLGDFKEAAVNQLFSLLEITKFEKDLKEIWNYQVINEAAYEEIGLEVSEVEFADFCDRTTDKQLADKQLVLSLAGSWGGGETFEGFSIAWNAGKKYKSVWIPQENLKQEKYKKALEKTLSKSKLIEIVAHDAKPLLRELLSYGLTLDNLKFDTRIAVYLIDPQNRQSSIEDLAIRYGDVLLSKKSESESAQMELTEINPKGTSLEETAVLLKVYKKLSAELEKRKETKLYEEMEIPLVEVLAQMEFAGIAVDKAELQNLTDRLQKESIKHKKAVISAAGKEFNVNSTKELGEVLFTDLGLPTQKRTKTGFSTDAQTLEKLKGSHKIIDHILQYRTIEKLRATYGEGLLREIKSDGRIHATFKQTVARTGRLSSDAPNLHNIPIRSEQGREFRKIFIADKGCELLVADYNQIELRCVAHLCQDPNLIEVFKSDGDVHTSVAERVFGEVPVPKERREQAKMISYGLMYGMEAFGLAQRLNIGNKEAQEILKSFFDAYPSLKNYMEETVATAKKLGYTETLFGRRRYIPDLKSSNFQVRAAAERQAMNSGIQGLAADIFKYALIHIANKLDSKKLKSRLILQVHDEVILEVPKDETKIAEEIVVTEMQGAAKLSVPLVVELTFGKTWADAKK